MSNVPVRSPRLYAVLFSSALDIRMEEPQTTKLVESKSGTYSGHAEK